MTARRLATMADAKRRDEWERTSWVYSALVNQNRKRGQGVTPDQVNPMLGDNDAE